MPKPLGGTIRPFHRSPQLEPGLLDLASRLAARLRALRATQHFDEIIGIVCDDVGAGRVVAACRYLEDELRYWDSFKQGAARHLREDRHAA